MTTSVLLCAAPADEAIAASFATGLARLGRKGAITVTRDADPGDVEWFVLIASPQAAADARVTERVQRRLASHGTTRLQVVVVGGEWVWDSSRDALDPDRSTAAPAPLLTAFASEPRHMVYQGDPQRPVAMSDAVFAEQAAELGAPMLGVTKDEIFGDEVRRHRRTLRIAQVAAGSFAGLALLAVAAGTVAVAAAAQADSERERAVVERALSESRRLAALSGQVSGGDGALAALLAIEAVNAADTAEARSALATVTGGVQAAAEPDEGAPSEDDVDARRLVGHADGAVDAALTDTHAATLDGQGAVRIWSLTAPGSPTDVADVPSGATDVVWSHDGATLAVASMDQVALLDTNGDSVAMVALDGSATLEEWTATEGLGGVVGPWGDGGFVAAAASRVVLIETDGTVADERTLTVEEGPWPTLVEGTVDGERVLVNTGGGAVMNWDADLDTTESFWLDWAPDEWGGLSSSRLTVLDWDGLDTVVLPQDLSHSESDGVFVDNADSPDAIAVLASAATGERREPVGGGVEVPSRARSAALLPDGAVAALAPAAIEAPATLALAGLEIGTDEVALPAGAHTVRLSPDGAWLLIAGTDEAVHVVSTGRTPVSQPTPAAQEGTLDSTHGDSGASAGSEEAGTASSDDVIAACAFAGRNMSEGEWAVYLPGHDYRATCLDYSAPHESASTVPQATAAPGQR